jgi:hypothetical protein
MTAVTDPFSPHDISCNALRVLEERQTAGGAMRGLRSVTVSRWAVPNAPTERPSYRVIGMRAFMWSHLSLVYKVDGVVNPLTVRA